jgi:hypothetical protein
LPAPGYRDNRSQAEGCNSAMLHPASSSSNLRNAAVAGTWVPGQLARGGL